MDKGIQTKYESLLLFLREMEKAAIAFSGGVDSTFLLAAAKEALGKNVLALTIKTPYIPQWEIKEAIEITRNLNIAHKIIELDIPDEIIYNPEDRCYLCKIKLFTQLKEEARTQGIKHVLDGTNYDDLSDYRPGMKALKKLNIISPLLENKLGKNDIRSLSKNLELPTWNKPAYACLLTRLPYGTKISNEDLSRIEKGEEILMKMGFSGARLRTHGELARIEINPNDFSRITSSVRDELTLNLKNCGYKYITLDLEGYKMGSFNK